MLASLDWIHDGDFPPDTVMVWDPASVVMVQGPPRTATYRDDSGSTGMIVTDFNRMTTIDKLRFANGGHIITEDTDGVIRVHCKKMYLRFGKKKFPLPVLPPIIITAGSAVATFCPVCARFVKVREQIINYSWNPIFLESQKLRVTTSSPVFKNIGVKEE